MEKIKFNLLEKQKELVKQGKMITEQTTETPTEYKFGKELAERGFKIIPNFIINDVKYDFRIKRYPIIIEIDGNIHNNSDKRQKDYKKDRLALKQGYRVVRFSNEEIHKDINQVVAEMRIIMEEVGTIPKQYYFPQITFKNLWKYFTNKNYREKVKGKNK